ncbi:ROK family protein [Ekhidna sp.]|uniref:ROK family protein n=1 Tax=Ekhidna sp. TaxID=2608089 RepID=UPI003B5136FB
MSYYIGMDIGGTSTSIGLVKEGEVLDRTIIQIQAFADGPIDQFIDQMVSEVKRLEGKHQCSVEGIGIGAPNGNYYNGTMELAPNMPWKEIHPIASMVEEKLEKRTILTNDANAGAIGEMQFGVAKNLKDFIYITLGTGLGSGIVCNGQVIYGNDGFAGEMGHSILIPDGRDCTCGRKGCLEAYVSLRGIKQTYNELGGAGDLSPNEIAENANAGNELCLSVYDQTGKWLGLKLADAAVYTSPEAIVFFGGIAEASDLFFSSLKESLEENVHNLYRNKIKLLKSSLPLNDAAILGSAALVMRD